MTDTFQALFEAVRAACSPGAWSRGVELTRASAVIGERGGEDEVVFRVSIRGGMISHTVRLFPEEADWECQCGSHEDACEHAAAAVIAWRRAREEGSDLPTAGGAGVPASSEPTR